MEKIEQTLNKLSVTGVLVENGLEIHNEGEENEFIGGTLTIRTEDSSEHALKFYANRFKKDKDGNFTREESKLYKGYRTVMDEYVDLKMASEEVPATQVTVNGNIDVSDFLDKQDGSLVTANKLSGKFASKAKDKDEHKAKFELMGIISKLSQETKKDGTPTGNGLIVLDVIGYNGKIIPVKLTVLKELVEAFGQAGFYEGCPAKLTGIVRNTVTKEEIVEKQAFGEDIHREITKTIKRFECTGGSPLAGLDVLKITQEQYEACKSQRKLHLNEVKSGETGSGSSSTSTPKPQQSTSSNAFSSNGFPPTSNPFA